MKHIMSLIITAFALSALCARGNIPPGEPTAGTSETTAVYGKIKLPKKVTKNT